MQLGSIDDAMGALQVFMPQTLSRRTNYNLDRITAFLGEIGNPQEMVRVIHVAGTSGKTSTAYLIRNLLQASGHRTGLTVSPHIRSITERVQIDGDPLNDDVFLRLLGRFLDLVKQHAIPLTYFEVLVAFAYWTFAEYRLDYAVVEVGLGGLLDGTSVVQRPDKVAVITDLGLDHTEILGDTIEAIALQKAGIIRPGNDVFMLEQSGDINRTIAEAAGARGGRLHLVTDTANPVPAGLPPFQRRNWRLAAAVYDFVARRDAFPALAAKAAHRSAVVLPPGRMDHRTIRGRTVILDGAHNPQKLAALCEAIVAADRTELAVLASFVQSPREKLDSALHTLAPIVGHLIVVDFTVSQDLAKVSFPSHEVAQSAREAGIASVEIQADPPAGLDALLRRPEPDLLVTGSLYLVGQVLALAM